MREIQNIAGMQVIRMADNPLKCEAIQQRSGPSGPLIKVGQRVVANGNFAKPAGAVGTVQEIILPFSLGRTSDILEVKFDDDKETTSMKFKDLRDVPIGSISALL